MKLKDVLDVDLEGALFEEVADLFLHLLVVLDVAGWIARSEFDAGEAREEAVAEQAVLGEVHQRNFQFQSGSPP